MEPLDRHIVTLLSQDGRMSYADLGRKVGLSTSAVHQRVKRLEAADVIVGYRAEVNHAMVGLPLTALISVVPFDPSAPDDIPERLTGVPQIVSCWSVAGDENYVLMVRVQRPQELEELLATVRAKGQCSTHTTVVLSTPWEARAAVLPDGDQRRVRGAEDLSD